MITLRKSLFAVGAAMALSAGAAQAQPTFYGQDTNGSSTTRASNIGTANARNAFLAFLGGSARTEEFESFLIGDTPPLELDFGTDRTIATLNAAGQSGRVLRDPGDGLTTDGFGRYANSRPGYYETRSTTDDNTTFTINFSQRISAFGFVGIDIGDFGSQLSLQFLRGGVEVATFALPYVASDGTDSRRDGSRLFAGFTASNRFEQFDQVRFRGTDRDDVFAFDDMTIAVVPEPATVGLLATGVAALGLVGYRRRRDQA